MSPSNILTRFEFVWDPVKILTRLGIKSGNPAASSPQITAVFDEIAGEIDRLLDPKAAWTVISAAETNGHPVFAGAVEAALGVSTIGPRLEEESEREFKSGDLLRGLVLDAFGSSAVVQVFRTVERLVVADALRRGLWPSRRYSPGYKGWPLEEQRFLFSKVDAAAIGVRLNESCMMIPRKSSSFRINFYADRALTTRPLPTARSGN